MMKKEDQDILIALMERGQKVSLVLVQEEIFLECIKGLNYDQLFALKEITDFYNSPRFSEKRKKYCIDFEKRGMAIQNRMDLVKQAGNVLHNINYN